MSESFELGIVGDTTHEHIEWAYYHSALHEYDPEQLPDGTWLAPGTGIYAVCLGCGLHRWNVTAPDGAQVFDCDTAEEDEEDEEGYAVG